ncbi:DsbA family protein [Pseudomonas guariconensis]|uniref:DsbA family oxidoreductase n=1 Tax=Pseudomonas guariconensis TaxID=1288410 RepID=UPI003F6912CF
MKLAIEITSDFICPWCFVAERRLAKALASLPEDVEADIRWIPFELNPDMPEQGMDRRTYRTNKFGSWARSQAMDAQTAEAAQADGIAFDYAAIERTPNTFLAHRLMRLASSRKISSMLAGAIFSAYFEQGRDITDVQVLLEIAAVNGLERDEAAAYLASEAVADEVRIEESAARVKGICSVPQIDIGGQLVSGAQSVETFKLALRRAIDTCGGITFGGRSH